MLPVCFKQRGRRVPLAALLLASVVVFPLLLAACGSGSTTPSATPDLMTPGVLTIGSDTTYPPQEYIDPTTNKAVGFDIDLITAIAQRMGLQTKIVSTSFDTILADLAARRFDAVISAVTITPDRQKQADFIPYLTRSEEHTSEL